jgi:hypothetical protein
MAQSIRRKSIEPTRAAQGRPESSADNNQIDYSEEVVLDDLNEITFDDSCIDEALFTPWIMDTPACDGFTTPSCTYMAPTDVSMRLPADISTSCPRLLTGRFNLLIHHSQHHRHASGPAGGAVGRPVDAAAQQFGAGQHNRRRVVGRISHSSRRQ